jgi:hypothetical protein
VEEEGGEQEATEGRGGSVCDEDGVECGDECEVVVEMAKVIGEGVASGGVAVAVEQCVLDGVDRGGGCRCGERRGLAQGM